MHVNCYYLISVYVFQATSKLNMDNNYSAILEERRNTLHLNNLYVLRRCMQVAILFKILTCQPTWYIREVYSGLPERPEIVRLPRTTDTYTAPTSRQFNFRYLFVNDSNAFWKLCVRTFDSDCFQIFEIYELTKFWTLRAFKGLKARSFRNCRFLILVI